MGQSRSSLRQRDNVAASLQIRVQDGDVVEVPAHRATHELLRSATGVMSSCWKRTRAFGSAGEAVCRRHVEHRVVDCSVVQGHELRFSPAGWHSLAVEEFDCGGDEYAVVLEDSAVAGVGVDDELGAGDATVHVLVEDRRHHAVVVAVGDECWLVIFDRSAGVERPQRLIAFS